MSKKHDYGDYDDFDSDWDIESDLHNHKNKDRIKWSLTALTFLLVIVLLVGLCLQVYGSGKLKPTEWFSEDEETQAQPLPETMTFTSAQLNEARAVGRTVDVRVLAIVEPANAINPAVDFSVSWPDFAPDWYPEVVTDYVTVTQDSDGSRTATVSCKKAFRDYNVILKVTTRDGGYTATCTCQFIGIASQMELKIGYVKGNDTVYLEPTSSAARGEYYELSEKKEYFIQVLLDNSFDCVTSRSVDWSMKANGKLYFGNAVDDGYGFLSFRNIELKDLNDCLNGMRFVGVSKNSEYSFKLTTYGTVEYSSASSEIVDGYYHYKDKCIFDEYNLGTGGELGVREKNEYNITEMPSCYFELTITDSASGLCETFRFWITF